MAADGLGGERCDPPATPASAPAPAGISAWPGVKPEEPLARHSQFAVGGPAQWFLEVGEVAELRDVRRRCEQIGIPVTVIGAGSNTLIRDAGIRGLVVRLREKTFRVLGDGVIELSAGYMMPRAALDCARRGLSGLEFGIGVPGTCGAGVWGNAGAFGTEFKDVLIDCDAVAPGGDIASFTAAELGFGYRHSRFKTDLAGHIVVAARFAVRPDEPAAVRARTDEIQSRRKSTQPYGVRSLGSTFKNPEGDFAGRLIEAAGAGGMRRDGAEVAPKHANFILNVDHASAAAVLELIATVHTAVLDRFGVDLEREIAVLGDDGGETAVPRAK